MLIVGFVCFSCIFCYVANILLTRARNDFTSFQTPRSIREYILSNLTIGVSTALETQDFMRKHIFNDDDRCRMTDENTHLFCHVKIADDLVVQEFCEFDYQFSENILTGVDVKFIATSW
jgi:hypothetical protein